MGKININEEGQVLIDHGFGESKRQRRTPIEEIEWRFGAATRMSTAFIRMYDRGDSAGINPIKNSFLGFLPRRMNPDKPHPSTLNGKDIYSQGMYMICREIHGYHVYNMVEFSTGGHAYWEFGWIGVIVLCAISGVYISLCSYYFQRFGVISIVLMVIVFKPWGYVDPKIWVSDIILQVYQIILPFIFIAFCLSISKSIINIKSLIPKKSQLND